MSDVDPLFGGEDAAKPNVALVAGLLGSGTLLAVLGLALTSIPGGLLILLAFHYADRELDRVDSGYLPESERGRVARLRSLALGGVVLLLGIIVVQTVLLSMGFYDALWGSLILSMRSA